MSGALSQQCCGWNDRIISPDRAVSMFDEIVSVPRMIAQAVASHVQQQRLALQLDVAARLALILPSMFRHLGGHRL
eukprot:12419559-Karenia_brevis.AAC.1